MSRPRLLAFYLPQYHPIPENNEWWGKGFTEWTNVVKAKKLFPCHYQPKIPADLGFYDLRVKEVQRQQIELAKAAKIEGFCYYHYWFGNGKMLLEKPIESVLKNKDLDFPFCFCWANHDWMKQDWNAAVSRMDTSMLIKQTYPSEKDIIEHFNYLLPFFKDSRYICVNGKPVFVIYDVMNIPNFVELKNKWNECAKKEGFLGIYFIGYRHKQNENLKKGGYSYCEGNALEMMLNIKYGISKFENIVKKSRRLFFRCIGIPEFLYNYKKVYKKFVTDEVKKENIYPVIIPNFDHSARRGKCGIIFYNSTPENFKLHVEDVFSKVDGKKSEENLVFIKSWNEWGEGNYIEPDLRYGHGYINVLAQCMSKYDI